VVADLLSYTSVNCNGSQGQHVGVGVYLHTGWITLSVTIDIPDFFRFSFLSGLLARVNMPCDMIHYHPKACIHAYINPRSLL
jgi:hypothetical protein